MLRHSGPSTASRSTPSNTVTAPVPTAGTCPFSNCTRTAPRGSAHCCNSVLFPAPLPATTTTTG
ncbi:hypothetical protein [Dactylosporangium cerinum]